MAKKPRAPRELTETFWQGAMAGKAFWDREDCWLRKHDPRRLPCSQDDSQLEAFHYVSRQRIRNVLGPLLLGSQPAWSFGLKQSWPEIVADLLQLAEWDARNAGAGCVHHHRRLDSHATPDLTVPYEALPKRVVEFAEDWGLESALEERYPRAS